MKKLRNFRAILFFWARYKYEKKNSLKSNFINQSIIKSKIFEI